MFANRRLQRVLLLASLTAMCDAGTAGGALAAAKVSVAASVASPVLTAKDAGTTVTGKLGDFVTVHLDGNVTTGYAWVLDSISTPAAVLVGTIAYDDTPAPGTPPSIGRPGVFTAKFSAAQPGLATIKLNYVGPDKTLPPVQTFSFTFDVAAEATAVSATADNAPSAPHAVGFQETSFLQKENTLKFTDGSSYAGAVKDGVPFGPGTYTWTTGNTRSAIGTWNGRALTGGQITLADGSHYSGDLGSDGKATGPAQFAYPSGTTLATVFTDGLFSGKSTYTTPVKGGLNGAADVLVVNVDPPASALTGPAVETFSTGSTITGTMHNGKFEGPATFRPVTVPGDEATRFESTFVDGMWTGPYAWIDADGSKLSGTIRNGSIVGRAVQTSPNGKRCSGQITNSGDFTTFSGPVDADGRANGRGKLGCRGDDIISGAFSHGKMVGVIVDHQLDGNIYTVNVGSTPTSVLTGPAVVRLANGNVATGHLTPSGQLTGKGTYAFTGDDKFVRHGVWERGILIDDDGN